MKKKIIIVIVVLVIIFFAFYIFSGSRFQKTSILELGGKKADTNTGEQSNADGGNETSGAEVEIAPDIEVKPSDCDNNCARFKKANEKEYCQIFCGTDTFFEDAQEEGGSRDDCADEKGIQKDYCLKDIGVGNKDFKTCDEIKDTNIRKSCQNRLTEDMIEEMGSAREPVE